MARINGTRIIALLAFCLGLLSLLANLAYPFDFYQSLFYTDLFSYWCSIRLFVLGQDPYDFSARIEVARAAGFFGDSLTTTMLPPWAFPLLSLLGVSSFKIAALLFSLLSAISLLSSFWLLRALSKGAALASPSQESAAFLGSVFLFATSKTTVFAVATLQLSFFLLLSMSIFLYTIYLNRSATHSFAGGLTLSFVLIKPQLLFLLLTWIFFESIRERRWNTLLGIISGYLVTTSAALIWNPEIFDQYLSLNRNGFLGWMTPTIGAHLIDLLKIQKYWLIFVPLVLALMALCIFEFSPQRRERDPLLLCIALIPGALLTSPYLWPYEYVLLLPCLNIIFLKLFSSSTCSTNYLFFRKTLAAGTLLLSHLGLWGFSEKGWGFTAIFYPLAIVAALVILQNNKKCSRHASP